jgi:hypothetical protein
MKTENATTPYSYEPDCCGEPFRPATGDRIQRRNGQKELGCSASLVSPIEPISSASRKADRAICSRAVSLDRFKHSESSSVVLANDPNRSLLLHFDL